MSERAINVITQGVHFYISRKTFKSLNDCGWSVSLVFDYGTRTSEIKGYRYINMFFDHYF